MLLRMLGADENTRIVPEESVRISKATIQYPHIKIDTIIRGAPSEKRNRSFYPDDILIKMTHFGEVLINSKVVIRDFIYNETDTMSGRVVYNMSTFTNKFSLGCINFKPSFMIDLDGKELLDNMLVIDYDELLNTIPWSTGVVKDNSYYTFDMDEFQNQYQIDYTDSLSPIELTLSSVLNKNSYTATMIFDSKDGMNVLDYKVPNSDHEFKQVMIKDQINTLQQNSLKAFKMFKDTCEKEHTPLRAMFNINPVGIIGKVFNRNHPSKSFLTNINNSDTYRIHFTNNMINPEMYGEVNYGLIMSGQEEVSDYAIDNYCSDYDYRNMFLNGIESRYHETSYPFDKRIKVI